jgi:hypothetical protein
MVGLGRYKVLKVVNRSHALLAVPVNCQTTFSDWEPFAVWFCSSEMMEQFGPPLQEPV